LVQLVEQAAHGVDGAVGGDLQGQLVGVTVGGRE